MFHGLRAGPRHSDSVVPTIASSGRFVFATNVTPARRSRAIASESSVGVHPSRNREEAVNGTPFTNPSKSFTAIGTPRNGPSGSGPLAAARASSYMRWTTALSFGFTCSIAAIAASVSSDGVTSPSRTRRASSVASTSA